MCLAYVQQQNKPLSAQVVVDALAKSGMTLTRAKASLSKLQNNGEIVGKLYGKTSYYLCKQDTADAPSDAEVAADESRIKQKKQQLENALQEQKELRKELQRAEQAKTSDQIKAEMVQLQQENAMLENKLREAKSSSAAEVTKEDFATQHALATNRTKHWKVRKRCVNELVGSLSEQSGKKPKVLVDDIGLEMHPRDSILKAKTGEQVLRNQLYDETNALLKATLRHIHS